ncbi:hypothetical protein LH163_14615 (plasmid) [Staphylococcus aureus]|nr:hypothetical protein LH163_14615 [Staphylococcus aureus]
MYEWIRARFHD